MSRNPESTVLQIRLPVSEKERIKAIALDRGTSMTDLILGSLRKLKRNGERPGEGGA